MSRGTRMGQEVGFLAAKIGRAIDCTTCGMGIAVDIVGRRWGEEPFDWRKATAPHACAITRSGLTQAQEATVNALEKDLEKFARGLGGATYQPQLDDSRLPPEKDLHDYGAGEREPGMDG